MLAWLAAGLTLLSGSGQRRQFQQQSVLRADAASCVSF